MHTHSCLCANKYVFFLRPQKEESPGIVCIWGGGCTYRRQVKRETGEEHSFQVLESSHRVGDLLRREKEGEEAGSYTHLLIRNLLEDKVIQQGQLLSYLQG